MAFNEYKIAEDIKLGVHTEEEDYTFEISCVVDPDSLLSQIPEDSRVIDIFSSNMMQSAACINHVILPSITENMMLLMCSEKFIISMFCSIEIDGNFRLSIKDFVFGFSYCSNYLLIKFAALLACYNDFDIYIKFADMFFSSKDIDIDLQTDVFSTTVRFINFAPNAYAHFINTYTIFNAVMTLMYESDHDIGDENLALAFEVILALSTTKVPEPLDFLNAVMDYALEFDFDFSYIINLQFVSILGNMYNLLGNDELFFEQPGIENVIVHYIEISNIETMRIIAPICYKLILYCIEKSFEIPGYCHDIISILEDIASENLGMLPDGLDILLLFYKNVFDK